MEDGRITKLILVSLVLGAFFGYLCNDPQWESHAMPLSAHSHGFLLSVSRFFGISIFLAALKVLIVPLVAATVFVAVARIGVQDLGRLGVRAILYYAVTMLIAVLLGIAIVSLIAPGRGHEALLENASSVDTPSAVAGGVFGLVENLVSLILPSNVLSAMVEGQTLSIICFFIFFGVVTALQGEKAHTLVDVGEQIASVLLRMVAVVLYLAPLGVFCLIFDSVAQHGLGLFSKALGAYVLCVLLGLGIHGAFVLPLVLRLFSSERPRQFFVKCRGAIAMAFGTASSSATLPVSLKVADEAELNPKVSGVVLPLGSTINMDGTALYEAVAVLFLAQLSGVQLGAVQLIVVAVTATLAAVGAAGIPSAGLVTLFIVVEAVNGSLQSIDPQATLISLSAVGLILGVDRILDMCRTAVNVWGDLVGAAILSSLASRELDGGTDVSADME